MTFESGGLLIVPIYIWLPPASYVVFLTTLVILLYFIKKKFVCSEMGLSRKLNYTIMINAYKIFTSDTWHNRRVSSSVWFVV